MSHLRRNKRRGKSHYTVIGQILGSYVRNASDTRCQHTMQGLKLNVGEHSRRYSPKADLCAGIEEYRAARIPQGTRIRQSVIGPLSYTVSYGSGSRSQQSETPVSCS